MQVTNVSNFWIIITWWIWWKTNNFRVYILAQLHDSKLVLYLIPRSQWHAYNKIRTVSYYQCTVNPLGATNVLRLNISIQLIWLFQNGATLYVFSYCWWLNEKYELCNKSLRRMSAYLNQINIMPPHHTMSCRIIGCTHMDEE